MDDETLGRVRNEVVELHAFFVDWYQGRAPRDSLEPRFLSHMDEDLVFTGPDGRSLRKADLTHAFEGAHGANAEFAIQIRDVKVRRTLGAHALVTYTEWQRGSRASARATNARVTTALMHLGPPIRWLHIQETYLPESQQNEDDFNF